MPLKLFDLDIVCEVDAQAAGWPLPGEAMNEYGLGGNRDYVDLRRCSWRSAREALVAETEYLEYLASGAEIPPDDDEIWNEMYEDERLQGLDLGIVSTVLALSAAGCVPVTSCNGGCLGDRHHEFCPLVVFFARENCIPLLLQTAQGAGTGLRNGLAGTLCVYADDILKMLKFAQGLLDHSVDFRGLRST